jgi:hypothetical protein
MFEFTYMEWTYYVHVCVFIKILWEGVHPTTRSYPKIGEGYYHARPHPHPCVPPSLPYVSPSPLVRALALSVRAPLLAVRALPLPCVPPSLPCAPPVTPSYPLPCHPRLSVPFTPSLPPYASCRFSSKPVVEIHLTFSYAMSAYSINGG